MAAKRNNRSLRLTPEREFLRESRRIVVKVGTRVLVDRRGRPDPARIQQVVDQVAKLRGEGREVVLVSSGAIGAGMAALKLSRRPGDLPGLQMAAAVGQSRLVADYAQRFAKRKITVGQVLLTHEDLKDRARHLNARNTLMALLRQGVVPIVNENDVVSVDEIRFSDNDHLASLVSILVSADLMVLLTTSDGVLGPVGAGKRTRRRIGIIENVDDEVLSWVWDEVTGLSVGGMRLKLLAARNAADNGTAVVIAHGRKKDTLKDIVAGRNVGTLISAPAGKHASLSSRKRWLAFFHRAEGSLLVDAGARRALVEGKRSLLPIGVRGVEGSFALGALVNVKDDEGTCFARGLVEYSSAEVKKIAGKPTSAIAKLLGSKPYDEVIHRDNIVVFAKDS